MPSRLLVVGSLLAFLEVSHAFIAFQPTCDGPSQDDKFNFVLSTQVRGTMDILWSCFAVLLLCTWSIQHLSVPDPRQSAKERHKSQKNTAVEDQNKSSKSFRRRAALMMLRILAEFVGAEKTSWLWDEFLDEYHWNLLRLEGMALCMMAPEFYLGKAFAENSSANASRAQFGDEENWSTAHAFFADMRGFIMNFETTAVETNLVPLRSDSDDGRNRHRTYPGGDPTPYVEQKEQEAIERELRDCATLHGKECPYRSERRTTEGAESDSRYKGNDVQEPGLNTVPNGLQATDKTQMTQVLTPLDVINLPEPLHTLSPEPPNGFSRQTTAVASPGSQRGRQWWSPLSALPSITEKNKTKSHHSRESPSGTQPHAHPLAPPNQPSPQTQPSQQLLPHPTWTGQWSLSSLQMYHATEIGLIPKQPYISRKSLKDQSKSDGLIKTLALWQLLWLTTQVLARAATQLPISQLEITVLAFSALSMITYILLWHKPQDVKCPSYISAQRPLTRSDVLSLAARAPVSTLMVHEFWLHGVNVRAMGDSVFPWPRGIRVSLPNLPGRDKSKLLSFEMDSVFFGMGIGGAVFGAVHFAAWDFTFPTSVERLLWRISCGIIFGFPVLMSAIYVSYLKWAEGKDDQGKNAGDSWTNRVLRRFGHVLVPVYLLARSYLWVEVFRSLAYSPPGIFTSIALPTMVPHYS